MDKFLDKAGDAASGLADDAVAKLADSLAKAFADLLFWTLTRLLGHKSPDLYDEPYSAVIAGTRSWLSIIVYAVALGGFMWQCGKLMLQQKADPAVNIARGFISLLLATFAGIGVASVLTVASDEFSTWVLEDALTRDGDDSGRADIQETLAGFFIWGGGVSVGLTLVMGFLGIILAFIQAMLMLFRDGALVVLVAIMPLAAAGSFAEATSGWIKKVFSWCLALIFYKPAVALIYAIALLFFTESAPKASTRCDTHFPASSEWVVCQQQERVDVDVQGMLIGFSMVLMTVFALPVLVKFFSFAADSVNASGSFRMSPSTSSSSGSGAGMAPNDGPGMARLLASQGPTGSASGAAGKAPAAGSSQASGAAAGTAAAKTGAGGATAGTAGAAVAGTATAVAAPIALVAAAGVVTAKGAQKLGTAGGAAVDQTTR